MWWRSRRTLDSILSQSVGAVRLKRWAYNHLLAGIQILQLMIATHIDQPPQPNMPCTQKLTAIRIRYRRRIVVINSRLARINIQEQVHMFCKISEWVRATILRYLEISTSITFSHVCTEFKSSTTLHVDCCIKRREVLARPWRHSVHSLSVSNTNKY